MLAVVRSLWSEPAVPDPPGRVWRDWALVVVLAPTAVLESILRDDLVWPGVSLAVGLVQVASVLWRRTRPLAMVATAFGAVAVAEIISIARDVEWEGLYTSAVVLLLPYALFRWGSGRDAGLGVAILLSTSLLGGLDRTATIGDVIGGVVILMLSCALGALTRYEVNLRARELDQAKLLEREQLARELHDTVAHHVSAIAVQAQAGRTLANNDPDAATRALDLIEEEASRTLDEMRSMVTALRRGDEADRQPRQGIADIGGLADDGTVPGPRVYVELTGDLDGVRPSVDAAVYRLAQESITNAVRHARHATRVDVSVVGRADGIELSVTDDGEPTSFDAATTGYGLIGMAERAKLLGGTFTAGPVPGRGWTTTAVLPRSRPPS